MTLNEICNYRINGQKIENSDIESVSDLVLWMGAIQAQDFDMANWAVGLRTKSATGTTIKDAYNKGEIIRTHILRPTWHFVTAKDIYWMLKLTAHQILKTTKTRNKQLELTADIFNVSNKIIEKTLSCSNYVTRQTIETELNKAGIITNENRLSHIMLQAELECLVCSGPILENNKLSYSLFDERVVIKDVVTRDESLAKLAMNYFRSHGPATMKDFSWWSGLTLTDSKKAIDSIQSKLNSFKLDSDYYYFIDNQTSINKQAIVHLLPAYDEFLISYANRNAALQHIHTKNTISSNGIFYPVILVNGKVVGIWKRNKVKGEIKIETNYFEEPDNKTKDLIKLKIDEYLNFL